MCFILSLYSDYIMSMLVGWGLVGRTVLTCACSALAQLGLMTDWGQTYKREQSTHTVVFPSPT